MKWLEAKARVKLGSRVISEGKEVIVLSYGADDQRIRVELVRAFDEDWLLLQSPVVMQSKAILQDALSFNARLAVGALALEQGYLMLRATCALGTLDESRLDQYVGFIAGEALRLRVVHGVVHAPMPGEIFGD